jgi:formate dehydrogenase maturation protein FdhE
MEIRARVAALAAAEPALADELAVRGALLELVDRAEVEPAELRLPADLVRARLAAGTPLLDGLDVPISAGAAHLFERLAVAMLADPATRQPAEALLEAIRGHRLHPEQLLGEALVGHGDHLEALADGAGVPAALVSMLADLASRPLLAEAARRLAPALGLGAWARGYCPACGARPIFAERDDDTSLAAADRPAPETPADAVRLRCGRCATAWVWSLPGCPDCPHGRLAMLDAPTGPALAHWRLLGCDACRAYLKLSGLPVDRGLVELLLTDLETWQLDRAALGLGLTRSSEPGRRLEHGEPSPGMLDDD